MYHRSIAKTDGWIEHSRRSCLDTFFPPWIFCAANGSKNRRCTMLTTQHAPLLVPRTLVSKLMRLYDISHPLRRGRLIRGYDRAHAVRTARMCAAVASALGHEPDRVRQYQIACLLHDLGRAGLDRPLFGKIWSWAKAHATDGILITPWSKEQIEMLLGYARRLARRLRAVRSSIARMGVRWESWM